MQQRALGATGMMVGAVGFGCMGLNWAYGQTDESEAIRLVHRAIDLGANMLDTSDVYGPFINEELVGRAIAGRRGEVVLATKCGLVLHDPDTYNIEHDASPEHIRAACEGSLQRLGVDCIDLYYLHRADPNVPLEESIGAMADLVDAGKVRYLGVCELDVPALERASAVHPLTAVQSELSLWTRNWLPDVVPWCQDHQVAFVAFAPLGRGFLTGRFRSTADLAPNDYRRVVEPRFRPEALETNVKIVDRVVALAAELKISPAQLAIAWVLAQAPNVIALAGTKHMNYLEENVAAVDLTLDPAVLAELDRLPVPVGTRA